MNRRDEIAANLAEVERAIANACAEASRSRDEITLIAVTKTFPVEDVQILYDLGIRNFGENRDQEGSAKAPALPSDAIWHFQGHIQSKKIKSIVQWAQWIHSVDDLEHAKKIAERSPGHRVLVQVDLEKSSGEKRGGVQLPDLPTFIQNLGNVDLDLRGLMSVAPLGINPSDAFLDLERVFQEMRRAYPALTNLSAGMSGDFVEAIAHGATHIRIGSSILGKRPPLI